MIWFFNNQIDSFYFRINLEAVLYINEFI